MREVLIDNWSLEDMVFDLYDTDRLLSNPSFHNILEAIVLWDNIYFPNNEYSSFWKMTSKESDIGRYIQSYGDSNDFEDYSSFLYKSYFKKKYTENVVCGAIRYSLIADKKGFDYLPCQKRSEFIQKSNVYNILNEEKSKYMNGCMVNSIMRNDFVEVVNREVKEYFDDFNAFYGKNVFELKMPVLANYIINTKPYEVSYFEYAYMLKRKLAVKQFLKYLSSVEKDISEGNFVSCNRFAKDMRELVDDICGIDREFVVSIDGTIISKPVLNYDVFKIRKINYCFLKKIIKTSISCR